MKQRVMLFQTARQGLSRVLETAECGKLGLGGVQRLYSAGDAVTVSFMGSLLARAHAHRDMQDLQGDPVAD